MMDAGLRKSAILLVSLGEEAAGEVLRHLPASAVEAMGEAMAGLAHSTAQAQTPPPADAATDPAALEDGSGNRALFAAVVLLGHLHYSIDVASAFFITYTIYHIAEKWFRAESDRGVMESKVEDLRRKAADLGYELRRKDGKEEGR